MKERRASALLPDSDVRWAIGGSGMRECDRSLGNDDFGAVFDALELRLINAMNGVDTLASLSRCFVL